MHRTNSAASQPAAFFSSGPDLFSWHETEARKNKIGIVWDNSPSAHIGALAWHPDGEHLICGSWDFVPKLLNLRTGRVELEWHGHAHWGDSVAVEPTRRRLLTGSSDARIRVWASGDLIGSATCAGW